MDRRADAGLRRGGSPVEGAAADRGRAAAGRGGATAGFPGATGARLDGELSLRGIRPRETDEGTASALRLEADGDQTGGGSARRGSQTVVAGLDRGAAGPDRLRRNGKGASV